MTPEHYYQWSRFNDSTIKNRILNASTARIARQIAQSNKNILISGLKINSMLNALRAKFSQYQELGNLLTSTNQHELIYHDDDEFWGDGGNGIGVNHLGKLLMAVRNELQNRTLDYNNPFVG